MSELGNANELNNALCALQTLAKIISLQYLLALDKRNFQSFFYKLYNTKILCQILSHTDLHVITVYMIIYEKEVLNFPNIGQHSFLSTMLW